VSLGGLNPSLSTLNSYRPAGRLGKAKNPLPLVVVARLTPVAV